MSSCWPRSTSGGRGQRPEESAPQRGRRGMGPNTSGWFVEKQRCSTPGDCVWVVKHKEAWQKFRAGSPEKTADWVRILGLRVQAWSNMIQTLQLGQEEEGKGQEGGAGTEIFSSANLGMAKLAVDRAGAAVRALRTTALFSKEVGGAVPFVGAALQLLGFVLEVASREREEVEGVASAHSRLLEVGRRIMQGLWDACQQNDEGYMAVLEGLMQFIEKAARALEQFQSKGNICRLNDAFWQTNSGPQSVLQVVDECDRRLNSTQTDRMHRTVKLVEGKVDRLLQRTRSISGRLAIIPNRPDAVALDEKVAAVRDKLLKGDRKHVVLQGMGGSGKTTLAEATVNDYHVQAKFGSKILFMTIGQNPKVENCLKRIQDAFVDDEKKVIYLNDEDFSRILRAVLKDESVLLVLDDVWEKGVLKHLDVVSMGSRVLITTRIAEVGDCVQASAYDVEPLNFEEGHELFCKCAFDSGKPSRWQERHVRDIVQECEGLPLALEVIGREVRTYKEGGNRMPTRFERERWATIAKELKGRGIGHSEVFDRVFCLSFDNLEKQHQSVLLDLVMLPEDHYVSEADVVEWQVHSGTCEDEHSARKVLRALAGKSLIIQTGEELMDTAEFQCGDAVHYHLHDVIRDNALKLMDVAPLAGRNRLVSSHLMGTAGIERTFSCTKFSASQSLDDAQALGLEAVDMSMLQILLLRNARIAELPASILVPSLVVLDLSSSGVTKLPPQIACLQSAKLLRVDGCDMLEGLPEEVGAMSQLEVLSMRDCRSVYNLPNSFWELSNLTKLLLPKGGILQFCPGEAQVLHKLSVLDLASNTGLKQLPPSLWELTSLTALNLGGCWRLTHLPASLGCLEELKVLILHGCDSLAEIPDSVTLLSNLEELDAQGCLNLDCLPGGIADGCPELRFLRLQGSQLELPAFVEMLDCLEVLGLPEGCEIAAELAAQLCANGVEVEREMTRECEKRRGMLRETPLHWAAQHGLMDMVEFSLRESEVDVLDKVQLRLLII
ncbi:unnamed protein product [Ostreobium quekettii]|uniref:NB-ARC domain-containing protein n=1 Tax=Ostreobium quekettii TaxID=121088 RepID=A0A8S1IZQ9_9CHLO|nr:unnamed protein product [Ostreobium quekettii]